MAASAALLLLGPMAMDAQAVSGGGGISTPLDGQDLSNQVTQQLALQGMCSSLYKCVQMRETTPCMHKTQLTWSGCMSLLGLAQQELQAGQLAASMLPWQQHVCLHACMHDITY